MNKFLLNLLVEAVKNKDIRAFLLEVSERMAKVMLPGLASIIPAAVGAGIKAFGGLVPDIHLPELDHIVETIRTDVNQMLPDGIDIPFVSDAFRNATGFDLSDILTGRKP
jgi:hypothetical protein